MIVTGIFSSGTDIGFEKAICKIIQTYGYKCVLLKQENIGILKQISGTDADHLILMYSGSTHSRKIPLLMPDVFICNDCQPDFDEYINKIISKNTVLLINADNNIPRHLPSSTNIITYGLSMRSTITVSGIESLNSRLKLNYCIQRRFKSINNTEYEIAEFPVIAENSCDIYSTLSAVTWGLVTDLFNKNNLSSVKF